MGNSFFILNGDHILMKNILILTPFYPPNPGGAESFAEQLAQEASKWFRITVLTFMPFRGEAPAYQENYSKKGFLKVYRLHWLIRPRGAWKGVSLSNMLLVFPKLAVCSFLLCLKNRYQIVHSQGLLSGLVGALLRKVFRVKHYMTLLALYNFKDWKGLRRTVAIFIIRNSDIIFVEGENGKKDVAGLSPKSADIRTFTHWRDQMKFKPDPKRLNDKIRVLFVGRPIPEKGMHIVQAAERILNDSKYEFTYVTDVKHADLPKIYQRHHILVVPSQYDEGYSRVVVEGASCGCAVITSDRGSLPEQIKEFGIVCSEPYIQTFASIILSAWAPNPYSSISYRYAKEHFTEKNARTFLDAYSEN